MGTSVSQMSKWLALIIKTKGTALPPGISILPPNCTRSQSCTDTFPSLFQLNNGQTRPHTGWSASVHIPTPLKWPQTTEYCEWWDMGNAELQPSPEEYLLMTGVQESPTSADWWGLFGQQWDWLKYGTISIPFHHFADTGCCWTPLWGCSSLALSCPIQG